MRENIARVMELKISQVGITATTGEGPLTSVAETEYKLLQLLQVLKNKK